MSEPAVDVDDRITQIYLKLNRAVEMLTEVLQLLESDGACIHENKMDTTSLGSLNKSFFCRDCREEFIIVMDEAQQQVQ